MTDTTYPLFLRRRTLGAGSVRGMLSHIHGYDTVQGFKTFNWFGENGGVVRHERLSRVPDDILENATLVRWGCTAETGVPLSRTMNHSDKIKAVNDKRAFRLKMDGAGVSVPQTALTLGGLECLFGDPTITAVVIRRSRHAQGRHLWVARSFQEAKGIVQRQEALGHLWYASEYIPKDAEYRVYVMRGRVVTVAMKTPENPSAVAWNVAQGSVFQVNSMSLWHEKAIKEAVKAANASGLDFCGVDVMTLRDDAFVLEVNSAPSLPSLSNNQVSYRQRKVADAFLWELSDSKIDKDRNEDDPLWRQYIHPSHWKSCRPWDTSNTPEGIDE